MSAPLPDRPSLDHLRHQARDLKKAFDAGDPTALARVHKQLGSSPAETSAVLKLSQAQRVVACEYGFASWAKLKAYVEVQHSQPFETDADPLHVWYASMMFLTAMDMGMLEFALCHYGDELVVEARDDSATLAEIVRSGPRDASGNENRAVPVDLVWERLLTMAELTEPQAVKGRITWCRASRYPYTHWTIIVSRRKPDRLDFELILDRVETALPDGGTGDRLTPGGRLMAKIRSETESPLSPGVESALQAVAVCYDTATFHLGAIRKIACLLPGGEMNADVIVRCAQLAGSFGYHTVALIEIAQIAAKCERPCPKLSRIAELVVLKLSGTRDIVRLARALAETPSEDAQTQVERSLAELAETADYIDIDDALAQQEKL